MGNDPLDEDAMYHEYYEGDRAEFYDYDGEYYCGETGLQWAHTNDGWRLIDSEGNLHVCAKPDPADTFVKIKIDCAGELCGVCTLVDRVPHQKWGFVYYCRVDQEVLYDSSERRMKFMTGEPHEWEKLRRADNCLRAEKKCGR